MCVALNTYKLNGRFPALLIMIPMLRIFVLASPLLCCFPVNPNTPIVCYQLGLCYSKWKAAEKHVRIKMPCKQQKRRNYYAYVLLFRNSPSH